MGLRHAVITSVDRDDLPDYGASAFVGVIRQIRRQAPRCKVEVLTPDFRGAEMPLAKVVAERPDVFNHNVEVVPRLYPVARRGSTWERSTRVLRNAKELGGDEVTTKSGLMVGLGESFQEMVDALGQLRESQVQVLTVGQYLRPTERHLPIVRYWHPDEFAALEKAAYELGFDHVAAGPLVRSSYHADQHIVQEQPGVGPLGGGALRMSPRRRRALLILLAAGALALLLAPDALASAGGGSSGFSGGGGGGGGHSGFALYLIFDLLIHIAVLGHGLGALVLLALALAYLFYKRVVPRMSDGWQATRRQARTSGAAATAPRSANAASSSPPPRPPRPIRRGAPTRSGPPRPSSSWTSSSRGTPTIATGCTRWWDAT